MKRVLKFLAVIIWPFLLVIGVIVWKRPQLNEKDALDRKELLSDTAKINAAHRTYEKVRLQQMLEDSDAVELAKKILEAKEPTRKAGQ